MWPPLSGAQKCGQVFPCQKVEGLNLFPHTLGTTCMLFARMLLFCQGGRSGDTYSSKLNLEQDLAAACTSAMRLGPGIAAEHAIVHLLCCCSPTEH